MALCIRAESSLSFSLYWSASGPVSLTAKRWTSQSRYSSLANTDRGRREMPYPVSMTSRLLYRRELASTVATSVREPEAAPIHSTSWLPHCMSTLW